MHRSSHRIKESGEKGEEQKERYEKSDIEKWDKILTFGEFGCRVYRDYFAIFVYI